MRTWTRCPEKAKLCGGPCTNTIRLGEPMLQLRVGEKGRVLVRCAECAQRGGYGSPPPDLPALVERVAPAPMVKIAHAGVGALPFDWRKRAAGEREPGEEG